MSRVCDVTGKNQCLETMLAMLTINLAEDLMLTYKRNDFGCLTKNVTLHFVFQPKVCASLIKKDQKSRK